MIITEIGASIEHPKYNDKDLMSFEFAINRRDKKSLDFKRSNNIWIICKNTRIKKITHSFGRLNQ